MAVEFPHRYDFALSFAGEDRDVAEPIFKKLQDYEVEVFYDLNEQHRILAKDVEEYLRPIYQSEDQYVVVLLGKQYPKKIWTKIESDAFKSRLGQDAVVPVWFADVPPTAFDTTRTVGGRAIDRGKPMEPQLDDLVRLLVKKLGESR